MASPETPEYFGTSVDEMKRNAKFLSEGRHPVTIKDRFDDLDDQLMRLDESLANLINKLAPVRHFSAETSEGDVEASRGDCSDVAQIIERQRNKVLDLTRAVIRTMEEIEL